MRLYRLLEIGEIIQKGDLFIDSYKLKPTCHEGIEHQDSDFKYLRPVNTEVVVHDVEEFYKEEQG